MSAGGHEKAAAVTRRRALQWVLGAAGSLAAGGAAVGAAYRFGVTRYHAPLKGLRRPLRVALLADLHYGPFIRARSVAAWVDAVNRERPDLIVLDGDLVDEDVGNGTRPLLDELGRLEAPLGAYAVWGNHDHRRVADLGRFATLLLGAGVEVLVNRGVRVRDDLYLAGIDDLRTGRPDLDAALAGRPAGFATVLLSHNPDVLPRVPVDVGLTLSGHTHGGQVCIPGFGPIVTSSQYGRRFAHGWVDGPARGYVTRGLGVTLLPIRVACPAELTILDLAPAEELDTGSGAGSGTTPGATPGTRPRATPGGRPAAPNGAA